MKNKDKNARTTFEWHYGRKHLTLQKWHSFKKVAKIAILQRL